MRLVALAVVAAVAAGCAARMRRARETVWEPETPEERDAAARLATRACSGRWSLLFPGIGQACTGKPGEGATLAALGAAELATGIAVAARTERGVEHPGAALPLLAFQDLWVYGISDAMLDEQRARRLRYVPPESLSELARAPFAPAVLGQPDVVAGLAGMLALGIGASVLAGDTLRTDRADEDANLFGARLRPAVGHPLAAGVGAGLFAHVAIAEEVAFRGWLQSELARATSPTTGWIAGSLVFGGTHALNALVIEPERRARYLAIGVPTITVIGGYIGWSYRRHGHSLSAPVALHFWYDLLLSMTFYLSDPQGSPLAARFAFPF